MRLPSGVISVNTTILTEAYVIRMTLTTTERENGRKGTTRGTRDATILVMFADASAEREPSKSDQIGSNQGAYAYVKCVQ